MTTEPTEQTRPSFELLNRIICPPSAWSPCLPDVFIKTRPEDFDVEEVPKYKPSGAGEHLFLWLQKTDLAAGDLVTQLSRQLKIAARDIGVAGQKDRRAVTRQFVSVPTRCEQRLAEIQIAGLEILTVTPHTNKLKTGHLAGNRFRLILRIPDSPDQKAIVPISDRMIEEVSLRLREMERDGFPNYFGEQRFGHGGRNIPDGIRFLKDDAAARDWKGARRRQMSRLLPSAVQSGVFNLAVAERIRDGSFRKPIDGDIVCGRTGSRPFPFANAAEELRDSLVPMGPMPGPDMLQANGGAAELEAGCLDQLGLQSSDFERFKRHSRGTRRRMVEYLEETACERVDDHSLVISFMLPAGSFATVVVQQLCSSVNISR